ncbi:MAG: ATP-dependent DNA helicase RecG [Deltaproteobacteria bacterium]|nr:MAG: ATP-dependent DNA helicase RecG [Deltaproteobacteria bacterium]
MTGAALVSDRERRKDRGLDTPIQYIKGVGPYRAEMLAAKGIKTVGDALFFLPRGYEDRRRTTNIAGLKAGEFNGFVARVIDFEIRRAGPRGRRRVFDLVLGDSTGTVLCRWFHFNPSSFVNRFRRGELVRVGGKVERYRNRMMLVHPEVEKLQPGQPPDDAGGDTAGGIVPVYPSIEGIYPRQLRRIMRNVVKGFARSCPDTLPRLLRQKLKLPSIADALLAIHLPGPDADIESLLRWRTPAQRRLIFEEFFLVQLGLAMRRQQWRKNSAQPAPAVNDLAALARGVFGFELTRAQMRVLGEIARDMSSPRPMNRLLQGDVGSGKTAVAALAAVLAARGGGQTAFMVPTEILAEQHYRKLGTALGKVMVGNRPMRVELLTASVKGSRREPILQALRRAEIDVIVGTHALIEQQVEFGNLNLCIIDEQHRFGVMQRARLRSKGKLPHVLVMTATPIPRTLAMTIHGDLDVSSIDELPPGRKPVRTVLLRGNEASRAYDAIRQEVEGGGQAYIVYPLVEESEKLELLDAVGMARRLASGPLAGLKVGLLHGRMDQAEKDAVMRRFVDGEIDVLVSTTVIEVGVDVPRANIMVVEHAERFGLSQLHQLRGRVGRGRSRASCYLVAYNLASADARKRLQVMQSTTDGFEIAEQDLAIRGPGEFLGTRQAGMPLFDYADLVRDADLLEIARREATALLDSDPELNLPENRNLLAELKKKWSSTLSLAEVG